MNRRGLTLAPKTLTRSEVEAVLAESEDSPRDHLILRVALGTSLRLAEIANLNVGQVYRDGRTVPRTEHRVKRGKLWDVMFSTRLQGYVAEFIAYKIERGESVEPEAPLFLSLRKRRISPRQIERIFHDLQVKAGLTRIFTFHALRHTAITIYVEESGDLVDAQRFARHENIETTRIYFHPSDETLRQGVNSLPY